MKMPQEQQPPFTPPHTPSSSGTLPGAASAGLLRRTISSEESGPAHTTPVQPIPQPTSPPVVEADRGKFVRTKPERAPKMPRPKRPMRIKARLLIIAVLLVVVWFVAHLGSNNQTSPTTRTTSTTVSSSAPTTVPAKTAPAGAPTPTLATPAPTAPASNLPPEQVAENFLAAYFTWDAPQDEKDYTQTWAWMVAPDSVATLEKAAPRHYLDDGNDVAAQSPTPNVPASAIHIQGQTATIEVNWTVEVIPPGGELSTWAPRELHGEVTLTHSQAGWQVINVTWGEGGP
jgi:hypothetical protein